jgi:gluconokinase
MTPVIVVVMGVTGCGKSTIGTELAMIKGWPFEDGDDLHPAANKAKMAAGHPLTDDDRWPWLLAVRAKIDEWFEAGSDGVIACSALKRAYREMLDHKQAPTVFAFLDVSVPLLRQRLGHRVGHFMPPSLLDSQLATLERPGPDEPAITISITEQTSPRQTALTIAAQLPPT